jgi:eight-cysteine-cluster-containing protein
MCVTTPCPQPPNTCQPAPPACGGFAGLPCPDGQICVDDPADDCDPANGGADCGGICTPDDGGDDDREPASGQCVRNGNDACETDADCSTGGCGGELCFNPANGGGFTTCDCFTPSGVGGCGCVAGKCTWYN